jgi:hypothetical protein
MSGARQAAAAVAALRIAYGVALLLTPPRTTKRWLGAAGQVPGGGQVAIRALGAREVALHTGALAAVLSGASIRPWFAASIAGDLADIGSTFAARNTLPDGSAPATAVVAGASAAISAAATAAVER